MTTPNILRLTSRIGTAAEVEKLAGDGPFPLSDPRSLAWSIASETANQLIQLQLLAKTVAARHLATYKTYLAESQESFSILHFMFPLECELLSAQRRLSSLVSVPIWEIAERILPPAQFYRTQPEIAEACRISGAVILDATTATFTTASIDPLAGRNLAGRIRSVLSSGRAGAPFFFHVAILPQQWQSIARTHFAGH
jgi:hypothetical protein